MQNYDLLNKEQKEAVFHTEGPLLILAGAGSGKTRVLTHRIAYLIEEQHVSPWNILAITFTKKAAGEMRDRVDAQIGAAAGSVWVSTFHSTCARILRRYIDRLGYASSFIIYDSDDQKTLMKHILKRMDIDTKIFKERMFLGRISKAKDELVTPEEFAKRAGGDFAEKRIAQVYAAYQTELKKNNALDYDDLLMKTVELFRKEKEVLNQYQERFRYIMIDEYQDTNTAQFELVALLSKKYENLCVVGDDDQSIYRFRGANIGNILNFEKTFPNAKVIRLEQNYRSTQNILEAANVVIKNNTERKTKKLWTDRGAGDNVVFRQFHTAPEEASYVVSEIAGGVRSGRFHYQDNAILYRTNAQSRLFEEQLINQGIPYRLVGGVNFYARKEIKDLLSYLRTIDNGDDDLAVERIINVPKRGIGSTAISRLTAYAQEYQVTFYDAVQRADEIVSLGRSAGKVKAFGAFIEELRDDSGNQTVSEILRNVIEKTGYVRNLEAESTEEAESRIENIDELLSKVVSYEESAGEEATLSGFLEDIALVADIDSLNDSREYVVLMTLHSAKGLEFPNVFMTGMEDGIFPGYRSIISADPTDLEEERRLCYVGITRAEDHLTMTCARSRMINGNYQNNPISRFIREIPEEMLDTFGGGILDVEEEPQESFAVYKEARRTSVRGAYDTVPKPFRKDKPAASAFKPYGSDMPTGKAALSRLSKGMPQNVKTEGLTYGVGDRVKHIKFGEGTVQAIADMERDYEITVEFDKAGVKKMMAGFAKLKKV